MQQPLLTNGASAKGSGKEAVGSTVGATVVNLLKNMVGAGLLNVCIAFKYSSVLGGVFIMMFSSFVCTAGFLMIGYCCSKTGARSFRDLWRLSMGPNSDKVVDFVLFFHTFFSCVGYITMIGDFSIKSASGLFPNSILAERREISIGLITMFLIFPLCLAKSLDALKRTSAIGLTITGFSCAYIFYDVIANAEEYGAAETLSENLWYVRLDMFKTLALFNGSFSAHYNAPSYYAELKDRSFANYTKVTLYAFGIATTLFTAFGLAGFARFGDQVLGNVLKNYSGDDMLIQLSWFFMMISTVFVFPHAFQRMRTSWNALFNRTPYASFLPTTIGLLAVTLYTGVAFTDIAVIKMIKGATLGVSIMFIFPSIFFLRLSEDRQTFDCGSPERTQTIRYICIIMMVVGVVQGCLALLVHWKVI